jgi:hypothetical protein
MKYKVFYQIKVYIPFPENPHRSLSAVVPDPDRWIRPPVSSLDYRATNEHFLTLIPGVIFKK